MKFFFQVLIILSSFIIFSCRTLTNAEKKSVKEFYKMPVKTSDNFIWGINGHPVTHLDYTVGDMEDQFKLLKEHQFEYYRVDITTNDDGSINTYPDKFSELLEKSVQYQIKVLPIIKFDLQLDDFKISVEKAYQLGNSQMSGFIKRYGKHFEYYELGNEQENKILYEKLNGMLTTDYDYQKFEILASYFKGMIDAIKKLQPDAKTMTSAGWLHWGYFDLLESAGIDFDIISYHWYSNMGSMFNSKYENVNIINTLTKKYNKPIWITELNKKDGSQHGSEEQQAFWVDYFIHELDYQSNIQALFIYELYDEPNLKGQDWISEGEAYYGIVKWKNTPQQSNSITYKPVSDVLKFRIEETKYGYEDFVSSLLKHVTNEKLNQNRIQYQSKELIVNQFLSEQNCLEDELKAESDTENNNYIFNVYRFLLNRTPTPNEMKYWENKTKRNKCSIVKTILLSEEYWEKAIWEGYRNRINQEP